MLAIAHKPNYCETCCSFLATSPLARACPSSGGREEMARLHGYELTKEEREELEAEARELYTTEAKIEAKVAA